MNNTPRTARKSPARRNGALPVVPGAAPRDTPELRHDELHVWTVNIDVRDAGSRNVDLLSTGERQRAARYRVDFDRSSFIQRRVALRAILAGYLGMPMRDVAFAANEFGKPSVLAPPGSAGLAFNTSHSGTVALIAVARRGRIGVDVERLRPAIEDDAIAGRFFTADEAAALAALHSRDRVAGFFNAWTRKEAVVKALGGGLSISLDSFEISLRPGEPAAILRWDIPGAPPDPLRIHHLEPETGYVGALAADHAFCICRCWKWPG